MTMTWDFSSCTGGTIVTTQEMTVEQTLSVSNCNVTLSVAKPGDKKVYSQILIVSHTVPLRYANYTEKHYNDTDMTFDFRLGENVSVCFQILFRASPSDLPICALVGMFNQFCQDHRTAEQSAVCTFYDVMPTSHDNVEVDYQWIYKLQAVGNYSVEITISVAEANLEINYNLEIIEIPCQSPNVSRKAGVVTCSDLDNALQAELGVSFELVATQFVSVIPNCALPDTSYSVTWKLNHYTDPNPQHEDAYTQG